MDEYAGISLPDRLSNIERRLTGLETGQTWLLVLLVVFILLTAGDDLTHLPALLRSFGL